MCRRLKGGRGAAAEGTGKVSFFPPHCPPRGEGADWVWEEGEALLSPACPCHSPAFLSSPHPQSPLLAPGLTAPLMGFCFPGLSWLEDTREQKGSTHPPEKQQGDSFGPASSLKVKTRPPLPHCLFLAPTSLSSALFSGWLPGNASFPRP